MIRKCGKKSASAYAKHEIPAGNFQEEAELKHQPAIAPSKDILSKETLKIIEQSLEQIPPIYRSVFILREVEGFSVAETAGLLSITTTNVKVRLNRCKALLQRQLEQVFTSREIYEFNLVFCDRIVDRVFEKISSGLRGE
jgi:RNA polymerase sigma-70 factor (ECF subfamily)